MFHQQWGMLSFNNVGTSAGHVYLEDGKSPAVGADVICYASRGRDAIASGTTDGNGVLRLGHPNMRLFGEDAPDEPRTAVFIARLPGSRGASILSIEADARHKPLTFILPPPMAARGKLTVAGKLPPSNAVKCEVLAAHHDKSRLNDLLSVRATVQPDGSFELAGLTPGRHLVQAALDGIWLSNSIELIVDPQQPTPPLQFDIRAPGHPSSICLQNADGVIVPGATLTVDRPTGPMTTPYILTADGAGIVHIPALEAGRQTYRTSLDKHVRTLVVPALHESFKPAELQVIRAQVP
jgi:hypothetical protein